MRRCLLNLDHVLDRAALPAPYESYPTIARLTASLETHLISERPRELLEGRLRALGLDQYPFHNVACEAQPFDPSLLDSPLSPASETTGACDRVTYVLSGRADDLRLAREAGADRALAVALRPEVESEASFYAQSLAEAGDLAVAPFCTEGLSVVLMAFNEASTVAQSVADVRLFCRLYFGSHEIIVVDDGSTDDTAEAARSADLGDVRVVRHPSNEGMGAALRSGFKAATHDLVTELPADRQVRAHSLARFLPHLDPRICVHGKYSRPHGGQVRHAMSYGFRLMMRHVGGLAVDFDGAYMFHRHWLEQVNLDALPSNSFLFSFEFLDALQRAGCLLVELPISSYPRQAGQSHMARPGRVIGVAREILRSRLLRDVNRSTRQR